MSLPQPKYGHFRAPSFPFYSISSGPRLTPTNPSGMIHVHFWYFDRFFSLVAVDCSDFTPLLLTIPDTGQYEEWTIYKWEVTGSSPWRWKVISVLWTLEGTYQLWSTGLEIRQSLAGYKHFFSSKRLRRVTITILNKNLAKLECAEKKTNGDSLRRKLILSHATYCHIWHLEWVTMTSLWLSLETL